MTPVTSLAGNEHRFETILLKISPWCFSIVCRKPPSVTTPIKLEPFCTSAMTCLPVAIRWVSSVTGCSSDM